MISIIYCYFIPCCMRTGCEQYFGDLRPAFRWHSFHCYAQLYMLDCGKFTKKDGLPVGMLTSFCTCVPSLNAKIHVLCRMLSDVRGDISGCTALTMYVALVVDRSPCLLVCYVTHSSSVSLFITARSELRKVLLLFVYEISRQLLNGFASKSQGRRVWSLAWTSLKIKVKGQR